MCLKIPRSDKHTATCPSTDNCCAGPRPLCSVEHSARFHLFCKKDTAIVPTQTHIYRMCHAALAMVEARPHAT